MSPAMLEFVHTVLGAAASLIAVLTGLFLFGRRFFDAEWVATMKRQRASVREFYLELFENEFAALGEAVDRARQTQQHVTEFRQMYVEGHRELVRRFEEINDRVAKELQAQEIEIVRLKERVDRGRGHA